MVHLTNDHNTSGFWDQVRAFIFGFFHYRFTPFNPFNTFHLYIYHQYLIGTRYPVPVLVSTRIKTRLCR